MSAGPFLLTLGGALALGAVAGVFAWWRHR